MTAAFAAATVTAPRADAAGPRPSLRLVGADPLEACGVRKAFARNEVIFGQDEPAEYVYLVESGVARTTRFTDDGRRQVGDFFFPGCMIGLEDGDIHRFSAEALTACVVIALRRRTLEAEARRNPELAELLWSAGARRLQRMQSHLLQIGRKSALERVAAVLAELAERSGRDEIDLPMSRQDLADYLNLTIETVSRMFTQLQASQIIRLIGVRRMRICDPAALRQLAA